MTWSSTNPSIATVSNGVVTPVSVGVTTIRAISTIDTGVSATAQVTITNDPVPVTGVTLNRDTLNLTLKAPVN